MANIVVLDDKTINQIAAGEVVERPVSVVKELVENSIDAGANSISIEIKDGGISLIRVTDNGSGIEERNIRTAFLRHATSKIRSIEDLVNVNSLGFRGEALSSICAVSQVELLTKTKESFVGYRYVMNGGKEMSLDEAGIPEGTTIIVRNLFYNTPARRKFLKSTNTEGNYITELIERIILSHPDISFKYIISGRERLVSAGNGDVLQNIYSVFGRDIAKQIIPFEYEYDGIKLKGYAGKAETSRGNRNFELFFVNNRYIRSKILSKACEEAYKNYLMLHRYPFVILYLEIPGTDLDVNVHPAKTEIRFLKENEIYDCVYTSLTDAVEKKEQIPDVGIVRTEKNISYEHQRHEELPQKCENDIEKTECNDSVYSNTPEPFEDKRLEYFKEEYREKIISECTTDYEQQELFEGGFLKPENRINHKIIGQIFNTYWIVELNDEMYIIDQHAAHEKVIYERLRKHIDAAEVLSQNLSPAVIITLTVSEIETIKEYENNLRAVGFEIEPFGGNEYAITAVPVELFGMNEKEYFTSVLDDLYANQKSTEPRSVNDRIATMACKAAIKGNTRITEAEARTLIDELMQLDNPYNCPHGRPTIVKYSKSAVEKMFKRIV